MSNREFRVRSRLSLLYRLSGMSIKETSSRRWLVAVVLIHLAVSIVHGAAHTGAHVELSQVGTLFVFIVILIGPLFGLVLTWPARRIGSWIIAITMAGSFVFGLVNHFLIAGDDHVSHVDPQWRTLFAASAMILAAIELLGSSLAIAYARERRNVS
jgi:peptidoglycan/LPS O-acetylase OafA/YrhL